MRNLIAVGVCLLLILAGLADAGELIAGRSVPVMHQDEDATEAIPQQTDQEDQQQQDQQQEDTADADQEQDTPQEDLGPNGYQMSEMDLMVRVEELVEQLQARGISEREDAENGLLHLGPPVLDVLEVDESRLSTDARERLNEVRGLLEKQAAEAVTRATTVTVAGTVTLDEVFEQLRRQTNNDVDVVEQAPIDFLEQQIVVNYEDTPFWTAVSDVMQKAGLAVDVYSGNEGELRLAPIGGFNPETAVDIPADQSGVFDVRVMKIDSSRNLLRPELNYSNIALVIRWEPRIQPISIDLPLSSIVAIDEFDQPMVVTNANQVLSGIVQPAIPELNFSVPMELVDRQVEVIKSLSAEINAVLPGRIETFRFEDIGTIDRGTSKTKAGATVTFGGVRKNEDLWSVTIEIGFDTREEGMDSYQGWVLDNEVYMIDDEGTRHNRIGLENFSRGEGKVGVRYLFLDDPSEWTLVYKTPAAVVKVPVKIELKDIPLP
ncbi:MAG: hypothetical protein AAF456_11245 [Planctomycetota bacterium]